MMACSTAAAAALALRIRIDRESLSRSGYIIVPVTHRVSRHTTTEGIFPLSALGALKAHSGHFVSVASAKGSSNKYKRHFIGLKSFPSHVQLLIVMIFLP